MILDESFKWQPQGKVGKLKAVQFIVVHHSASPANWTVEDIDREHKARGWGGIGYHFVVTADGVPRRARPKELQGAHCAGYNHLALGVCLVGNFMQQEPLEKQLKTAADLCRWLRHCYPNARVVRHRELSATDCPGDRFPWSKFLGLVSLEGEDWREQIVERGKNASLLSGSHKATDVAEKWFVVQLLLNHLAHHHGIGHRN
jgi:N-acetyl-anhydromuramyl-L-alanine amidase AmpD